MYLFTAFIPLHLRLEDQPKLVRRYCSDYRERAKRCHLQLCGLLRKQRKQSLDRVELFEGRNCILSSYILFILGLKQRVPQDYMLSVCPTIQFNVCIHNSVSSYLCRVRWLTATWDEFYRCPYSEYAQLLQVYFLFCFRKRLTGDYRKPSKTR